MSSSEDDQQPRMRSQSISSMMTQLSTPPPPPRDNPEVTQSVGENLLDALCIKYSSQPSGLIIYDDRLMANIIGEFSVDEFRRIYQTRKPLVLNPG